MKVTVIKEEDNRTNDRPSTEEYQGQYKLINDNTSIALSLSFDRSFYRVRQTESSIGSIVTLNNDSLIIDTDYGSNRFFRLK
jgi:hypothetical protein